MVAKADFQGVLEFFFWSSDIFLGEGGGDRGIPSDRRRILAFKQRIPQASLRHMSVFSKGRPSLKLR